MKQGIVNALKETGISSLTPTQKQAVGAIENGNYVFIEAPTGSGKTFAYLIPLLDQIDASEENTRALIIAPTRELALQIGQEGNKLSAHTGHHLVTVIGGMDIQKQENALKHRPTILIGTAGRLLDLLSSQMIDLSHLRFLVMDEADQILSTGQKEDVQKIISFIPSCQHIIVSATWDERLNSFLPDNYIHIQSGHENTMNERISAWYWIVNDKRNALLDILIHETVKQAIVFTKYRNDANELSLFLQQHHILSAPFSSYYDERKRRQTLKAFKEGKIRILVSTDAASRGLDIKNITHIIHYDIPENLTDFIHRSGRSAHQNNEGSTIVLLTNEQAEEADFILNNSQPYLLPNHKGNDLSVPLQTIPEETPDAFILWIGAGKKDKIRPKDIIGALCTITDFKNLGALEIQDTYSTITIQNTELTTNQLENLPLKGKKRKYKMLPVTYR